MLQLHFTKYITVNSVLKKLWSDDMSGAKSKGGTGRGTDKKGWNRWQAGEKKKLAKKVFGRNQGAKSADGEKGAAGEKIRLETRMLRMPRALICLRGVQPLKAGIPLKVEIRRSNKQKRYAINE